MSDNDSSSDSFLPPPPPPPPPPPSDWNGEEVPPEIGGAPFWDEKPKGKPKAKRGEGQSLTWLETWRLVLTEPRVESFQTILSDPQASTNRAYTWIFVSGLIAGVMGIAAQSLSTNALFNQNQAQADVSPICGVLLVPVGAALAIVLAIIIAGLQHFVANALGGSGSYNEMVYSYAAVASPISLISAAVNLVPIIGCLSIFVGFYALALNVIAVKAVYGLDTGRAIVTVFWWVVALCLCAILALALIMVAAVGTSG